MSTKCPICDDLLPLAEHLEEIKKDFNEGKLDIVTYKRDPTWDVDKIAAYYLLSQERQTQDIKVCCIEALVRKSKGYYRGGDRGKRRNDVRKFHNDVKRTLYNNAYNRPHSLVDLSAGRGGDVQKWADIGVKKVLALELDKENIKGKHNLLSRIHNPVIRKKGIRFQVIQADTSKDIMSGQAGITPMDKKALTSRPATDWMRYGFDIVSCQFSIHYYLFNRRSFNGILDNMKKLSHRGSAIIITCFDGMEVHRRLEGLQRGQSWQVTVNQEHYLRITKRYEGDFEGDREPINYQISVFQPSIGAEYTECLVKPAFLISEMAKRGMVLDRIWPQKTGLPASGNFSEMYLRQSKRILSPEEEEISFLNRYYVFYKK